MFPGLKLSTSTTPGNLEEIFFLLLKLTCTDTSGKMLFNLGDILLIPLNISSVTYLNKL